MQPYYRVHSSIKTLNLFSEDAGEQVKIDLDPRKEYKLNVLFTMANGTVKIIIPDDAAPDGRWSGFLVGSRAIEIANFSLLFDGRFNDDPVHSYLTKQEVNKVSLFDGSKWILQPVLRTKVRILERTDRAFRLDVGGKATGWSRNFADVELTEFGKFFDGRFNSKELV